MATAGPPRWPAVLAGVAAFTIVASSSGAFAASQVPSIQEFVAEKDRWPQLVGRPFTLEGRYTVFSKTEMRFAGCDLRFLLPPSTLRPRGDSNNVAVSGRLAMQDGQIVFLVREVNPRPSDKDVLDQRRVMIDSSRPEEFYQLGQWARDRGRFYKDDQLTQAATGLFEEGLSRAAELLEPGDIAGMRSLAAKVSEFGLPEQLRQRYLHDANRAAFEAARQQPQPDYRELLQHIVRELPGSGEPLPADQRTLQKHYSQAPQAVYSVAEEETRRLLNRIFFSEVALAEIEQSANPEGSNGYEVATRIEKQLPERTDLAKAYRDRELEYLDSRIPRLTRQQMLSLAGRYEERGQPDQATETKRNWLKSREKQAQADGPRGLMDLGEEYLNLLLDERAAARMFRLAYDENPQLATAAQWLAEHGYELRDGTWRLPGETEAEEQSDLDEAIHLGRPEVGMTGAQVRAALGAAPSSVVRLVSAGQFAEVWLFEELDISVQLTRRSHQKELTVRRVTNAP